MRPGHFGTAVVVSGLDFEITTAAAKSVELEVRAFGADANLVNGDGTVIE